MQIGHKLLSSLKRADILHNASLGADKRRLLSLTSSLICYVNSFHFFLLATLKLTTKTSRCSRHRISFRPINARANIRTHQESVESEMENCSAKECVQSSMAMLQGLATMD